MAVEATLDEPCCSSKLSRTAPRCNRVQLSRSFAAAPATPTHARAAEVHPRRASGGGASEEASNEQLSRPTIRHERPCGTTARRERRGLDSTLDHPGPCHAHLRSSGLHQSFAILPTNLLFFFLHLLGPPISPSPSEVSLSLAVRGSHLSRSTSHFRTDAKMSDMDGTDLSTLFAGVDPDLLAAAAPGLQACASGGNSFNGYTPVRISAVFVILVTSLFGMSPARSGFRSCDLPC